VKKNRGRGKNKEISRGERVGREGGRRKGKKKKCGRVNKGSHVFSVGKRGIFH
jgi:hypothetical protein